MNIDKYIKNRKCIIEIYKHIVCCDFFEGKLYRFSSLMNNELYILLGIIIPYNFIYKYRNKLSYSYIYNNYFSNSMISINQHKIVKNFEYYHMYDIDILIVIINMLSPNDMVSFNIKDFTCIKKRLLVTSKIYNFKPDKKLFDDKIKLLQLY